MELTRADRNHNPTALSVDLAHQAGLELGTDYARGDDFQADGHTYYTARLLHDPIWLTLRVIDKVGFFAGSRHRWNYIAIPPGVWGTFSRYQRILTVKSMYWSEGGTEMAQLFEDALERAHDHAEEDTRG